jgi:hypothetical protein
MATRQIETATVIVATTIGASGNAAVIVTSAYMSNSPKTFSVAVTSGDDASAVAGKIRAALVYDADIAAQFLVSGATDKIVLTAHTAKTNDTTLNISVANDTCVGITNALTSVDTLAGVDANDTNSYCTLAEYKTWIAVRGLNGTVGIDASDDAAMEILIEAASRYIDRETGRRFYLNAIDETRYYTPSDDDYYDITIDPLATITSIGVDYSATRSYTLLDADDYDLIPENAALDGYPYTGIAINSMLSTAYFPFYRKAVRVIGKFGWPTAPADIKEAVLSIAQNLYGARSGQSSGGRVTVTAAGVVIRPEDVSAFVQKIIEHYRGYT